MQKHPLEFLTDAFGKDTVEVVLAAAYRSDAAYKHFLSACVARQAFEQASMQTLERSSDAECGSVADSGPAPQRADLASLSRGSPCACCFQFSPNFTARFPRTSAIRSFRG